MELEVLVGFEGVWFVLVLRAVSEESGLYERIGLAEIDPAWDEPGCFRREHISII